jgi:hypothetical protein
MMQEIYSRASHVVIWLGEETDTDRDAFLLSWRFEDCFKRNGFFQLDEVGMKSEEVGLPPTGSKNG